MFQQHLHNIQDAKERNIKESFNIEYGNNYKELKAKAFPVSFHFLIYLHIHCIFSRPGIKAFPTLMMREREDQRGEVSLQTCITSTW